MIQVFFYFENASTLLNSIDLMVWMLNFCSLLHMRWCLICGNLIWLMDPGEYVIDLQSLTSIPFLVGVLFVILRFVLYEITKQRLTNFLIGIFVLLLFHGTACLIGFTLGVLVIIVI